MNSRNLFPKLKRRNVYKVPRVEFRPYTSDPRFVDLIRRMGLDPVALLNREGSR